MLWIEPESGDEPQGLGFFAQYGWSPSDRNAVDRYHGVGMTYRGLVPQRDIDLVGVRLASAHFSAAGTNREEAVELFYKTQITDWFTIQPDMVHNANPSGINNDAFIVGLRSEIVF
jgi:carbohydrate-selective porin OprB